MTRPQPAHRTITHARRVLFVRTDRLGETVLNLPAVAAVKAALPQASLTLLVHPTLRDLLADAPGVDAVWAYPLMSSTFWWMRAAQAARLLRQGRFDIAIVSNPTKELHAAVWLAGIPCRVGYDRKLGWLLTHCVPDRKALGVCHEVEYNLQLVQALGLPTTVPSWQWPSTERDRVAVLRLCEQQGLAPATPFIAVHPWASNPVKAWPMSRFRELIQRTVDRLHVKVVLIGGPEAIEAASTVIPSHGLSFINLVGRLTLTQLAELLRQARVLVSNDSGPVHLAAAVQTPTVVLFGTPDPATGPGRWGPWGEGHVVIWKPSMDAIAVEEVFAALAHRVA